MKIGNKLDVKVTGVYEDLPSNTQFRKLRFIAPWDLYVSSEKWIQEARDHWGYNSFQLFAQIDEHADYRKLNALIKNVKLDKVPDDDKRFKAEIFLFPMCSMAITVELGKWYTNRWTYSICMVVWYRWHFCIAAGLHQFHESEHGPF